MASSPKRILSGMQPSGTGRLHLGNLVGALENWVRFQEAGWENYHMVADWHTLTTKPEGSAQLDEQTLEVLIDWLSAGLDPEKSVLFIQSHIPQHAELFLIFSMLVTTARLERNPTLKEVVRNLDLDENISYGHLGYPVLQAADILLYKANAVPVGEDQLPHLEITREIARRFNKLYKKRVFPIPEPKLSRVKRLPGLDGNKMSKSLGNTIYISDSPEQIQSQVMSAITDPEKIRKNDPGHPEICNVFAYHTVFNEEEVPQIEQDCRSGALGCVDCKKNCAAKITEYLAPVREKRAHYVANKGEVIDIANAGDVAAGAVARETMADIKAAMKLRGFDGISG